MASLLPKAGFLSGAAPRLSAKAMAYIVAAATMVVVSGLLIAFFIKDNFWAYDFAVYWRAAGEPIGDVYKPHDWPFPYLPTMLLWVRPLVLVPQHQAYLAFVAASAAGLWLACRPHLTYRAMLLVFISPPLLKCLRAGQVSAALAALLLVACSAKNRVVAGVIFGIIASIKPQIVLLAPLLLLFNRDWRALLSAATTFIGLCGAATLAFGPAIWRAWAAALPQFHDVLVSKFFLQSASSPAAIAEWSGLSPLPFLLLGGALGAFLAFHCRARTPIEQCTAITAGSILASPYAMHYDLTGLLPGMAYLVTQGRLLAVLAMLGSFNPLPVAVAAFELLRPHFKLSDRNSLAR